MSRVFPFFLFYVLISFTAQSCAPETPKLHEMKLVARTDWKFPMGTDSLGSFNPWLIYQGIALHDSTIYFGDPEYQRLNALQVETGRVTWGRKGSAPRNFFRFAFVDDRILISTDSALVIVHSDLDHSEVFPVPNIKRAMSFYSVLNDTAVLLTDFIERRTDSLWYEYAVIVDYNRPSGANVTRQLVDSTTDFGQAIRGIDASLRKRIYYLRW